MTYPPGPPGSPGYPQAQQPTTQFSAPTQQFGKVPDPVSPPQGPSPLPLYLTATIAVLGLAVYLSSFGPLFTASTDFFTPSMLDIGISASILAGLLAAVALMPRQKVAPGIIAVLSVLSFLLVIAIVLTAPDGVAIDWGMYLIIAFTVLQSIIAVAVLLFDAGVITPPAPRPRYEQQYGSYGGPYYGQLPHGGPHQQQGPQQQRPGYPSPYGGYPGGPSTGGYSTGNAAQPGTQSGPPTPPTGFPAYGQPPSGAHSAATPSQNTQAGGQNQQGQQAGQNQQGQTPGQQESPSSSAQSAPPPS